MTRFYKIVFALFICLFLFSCSSTPEKEENIIDVPVKDSTLQRAVVISSITCKADPSLSYALYLPKKYTRFERYPVVFLFDPHGNGAYPIEIYKGLAEKYGYILAGSNNSKNGMSWEQNNAGIKVFMKDVFDRLNVDANRIYTCGFSGGSRVASSVAIFNGGVNCVIGMGAGFPSLNEAIRSRFDYIGFAGNEDFNMNEMINLSASMDKSPIRHQLIVYNGKHEWAPASVAEEAFIWTEFTAMKDGMIARNDSLINYFMTTCKDSLAVLGRQKMVYESSIIARKADNYLKDLADVPSFTEAIMKDSTELKKQVERKSALNKEEMIRMEEYRGNFALKNLQWWTAEVKKINAQAKNKSDKERAVMNKRILNFLSLAAYMNAKSAMEAKQYALAEDCLAIYQMVDPENPEHQYLLAQVYMIRKDQAKAGAALKKCFDLGFKDIARIEADTLLREYYLNEIQAH